VALLNLPLYGAIEAGGTKFECALARGTDMIVATQRIATRAPEQTFDQVLRFFDSSQQQHGAAAAFGIAAFGPLDLDRGSPRFGHLRATPKEGWSHYDLTRRLRERFERPIGLDTDVNAAALAEARCGSQGASSSLVYVTVGTGIGGGAVWQGRTRNGLWHPEMGHIRVRRHPQDMAFAGVCPFHRDCLEGLASGPAILARWGKPMRELASDRLARAVIGDYLGQLASTIALLLTPERIIFGGGVMCGGELLPDVRQNAQAQLAGYIAHERLAGTWADFIVGPSLGERSGLIGALLLAAEAGAADGLARPC
jgi:fructokinase